MRKYLKRFVGGGVTYPEIALTYSERGNSGAFRRICCSFREKDVTLLFY